MPIRPLLSSATFVFVSLFIRFSIKSPTSLIGIAYPIPSTLSPTSFEELMPITSPFTLTRAPPLFPSLIAASVWINFTPLSCVSPVSSFVIETERFNALITPVVTDCPYPSAFPMAIAGSPTFRLVESPRVATEIASSVSSEIFSIGTAITATSYWASVPLMFASTVDSSVKATVRVSLPATTWLFVTINNSVSVFPIIIPVPAPFDCCS